MSRASDLRDEILCQLRQRIGSVPRDRITKFLVPDFERDELEQPRIGARLGKRDLEEGQGPSQRLVTIEVGVIGLTEFLDEQQPTLLGSIREQMVDQADALDGLMEEVIALWTPRGPLSFGGYAGHSFHSIGQPYAFDPKQLYSNGVWVSIVEIQYRDSKDI